MKSLLNKRPTIADVARQANVSTATVSRALQTPELVSESTRNQVIEVVARTGYRANTAAKMLRQNRSRTLLVMLPDIANPFFSEILSGIEDAATEQNHTILIGNTNGKESRARDLLENLRNGRADGALLLNGDIPLSTDEIAALSLVSISENIPGVNISHVGTDNVKASSDATQHLIDLGHKRIAHLCGPEGNVLSLQREQGYQAAMKSAGLQAEIKSQPCGFTVDAGQAAAMELLDHQPVPTAIFCANDATAMGAITALLREGLRVPDDISVVGFDDIAFASIFSPPLTTISQQRKELGQRAALLLLDSIRGSSSEPRNIVIDHTLIQRASTSKPNT